MPVRSLSSHVLKWPDAPAVDRAIRAWAEEVCAGRADVVRIGYFGSYARGNWGVGSDLDVLVIVKGPADAFERRGLGLNADTLPVPADLLVYTEEELSRLSGEGGRFAAVLADEVVWVHPDTRSSEKP
jgi:predicted nucleotidyltransferase